MKLLPWEPNFDFYFSSWQSARLVINVDLGAEEVAPLETHPIRLQARFPMRHPRSDGLRERAEADALFALEDLLGRRFRDIAPVLQVGRVVGAGEITLVWYAPRTLLSLQQRLEEAVRDVRGRYDVRLSVQDDPAWTFYFDFLLPDVYSLQVMLNRRRLLTLQDHRDDGTVPRLVDHRASFYSKEQALEAAHHLEEGRFVVDEPFLEDDEEEVEIEATEPLPATERWVLEFQRSDTLSEGRIDHVCMEILDILLPQDGHYEGWGTSFVPTA